MSTSSLSNNSLNSSGGTFNSNSSLNSTPSADRYAALKDLDEQLRDAKVVDEQPAVAAAAGELWKASLMSFVLIPFFLCSQSP